MQPNPAKYLYFLHNQRPHEPVPIHALGTQGSHRTVRIPFDLRHNQTYRYLDV